MSQEPLTSRADFELKAISEVLGMSYEELLG